MEPFLENGSMAGKILCPNEKCKAKIGNYDWAGVQCGCKDWVVPVSLFTIFSSLVDAETYLLRVFLFFDTRVSVSQGTRSTRFGRSAERRYSWLRKAKYRDRGKSFSLFVHLHKELEIRLS
jgi:hypothetical protein